MSSSLTCRRSARGKRAGRHGRLRRNSARSGHSFHGCKKLRIHLAFAQKSATNCAHDFIDAPSRVAFAGPGGLRNSEKGSGHFVSCGGCSGTLCPRPDRPAGDYHHDDSRDRSGRESRPPDRCANAATTLTACDNNHAQRRFRCWVTAASAVHRPRGGTAAARLFGNAPARAQYDYLSDGATGSGSPGLRLQPRSQRRHRGRERLQVWR